jgi:hypothetical protein
MVIASGSSSAQAPCPSQSMGLTSSFSAIRRTLFFLPLIQRFTGAAPSKEESS